jgi:hypothetical protein
MAGMARTPRPPAVRARRTVVGTLDADRHASVDPLGRVHLDGEAWSLDWWIGAEDRWHVPADESAVRQGLVGAAPVVETRVRVPSGDAVQRTYAARSAAGAPVVVVEVENDSKVPFAVAFAVRSPGLDGWGVLREVSAEGTEVRVEGKLVLVAARAPGRRAAIDAATADGGVAQVVQGGAAQPEAAVEARSKDGQAEVAVVFPVAHGATIRIVLPFGGGTLDVDALPSADQVAKGWRSHAARGARVVLPDRRLQEAVDANICHLLLRPEGRGVAAALDRFGFVDEAAEVLLEQAARTTSKDDPGDVLLALAAHWTLTRDDAFAEAAVPLVASLVAALGHTGDGAQLGLGAIAAGGAAGMLAAAGQARGADDVRRAGAAMAKSAAATPPPAAPSGPEAVVQLLRSASPTWTWVGPDDGHETSVGAAVLMAARALLLAEADQPGVPAVQLCADVPEHWLGQGWEAHDLLTAHGRVSYAVRWHGDRAALLWERQPWRGSAPVRITAPVLDPTWSSEEPTGEALLGPVALPTADGPPAQGVTTPVTLSPTPPREPG